MTVPDEVIGRVERYAAEAEALADWYGERGREGGWLKSIAAGRREFAADLRLLLEEVGSGWRPIETAPKDGRRILATGQREDGTWWTHAVHWGDDGGGPDEDGEEFWSWCVFVGDPCNWRPGATHWRPLPSPPTNKEGGEG